MEEEYGQEQDVQEGEEEEHEEGRRSKMKR